VAARYYEDPSGDDKFTDDGWLRTGDIGEIDEEGYVRITDRAKDLIKSGGEWISSVEVETLLVGHPAVREAAVIAMPDERWGERPLACVALTEGSDTSLADLREHLSSGLARWQLPDAFAFIDEVPKTSVGKFDKKVLRARLADGDLEVVRAERGAVR
jgi:fatty-acyl-CoA synthase